MSKMHSLYLRHTHGHTDNGNLSKTDINYVPNDDEYYMARAGTETWEEATKWGHYTTWLLITLLGLATIAHVLNRFYLTRRNGHVLLAKLLAIYRLQSYYEPPQIKFRDLVLLRFPALGKSFLFAAFFVTATGICFGIKPLYRLSPNWGAPPVANRGEWFAMALIPWVFVAAAKISPVTILTRISHDRLQVWHQWGARLLLFFSTVHGAPYIYQRLDFWGPAGLRGWITKDDYNWTGVAAYIPLFWLVFSSFSPIRNSHYEWWIVHHIISAILFVVFMFMHIHALLDSEHYLWATIGIMLSCYLLRLFVIFRMSGFLRWPTARAEMPQRNVVKLTIPTTVDWLPGSHVYVRFPTLNILQAHPFTIASVPTSGDRNSLELYIGVRKGMTMKLMRRIRDSQNQITGAEFPVIVDGAFSGVAINSFNRHDRLMLFAGGAGLTYVLPLLLSVIKKPGNVAQVSLIWALPTLQRLTWLNVIEDVVKIHPLPFQLDIEVHITRSSIPSLDESSPCELSKHQAAVLSPSASPSFECKSPSEAEKGTVQTPSPAELDLNNIERCTFAMIQGRPIMPEMLQTTISSCVIKSSIGVAVCGPGLMAHAVSNAAAKAQLEILRGRSAATEVVLYKESFTY